MEIESVITPCKMTETTMKKSGLSRFGKVLLVRLSLRSTKKVLIAYWPKYRDLSA